MQGIGNVRDTLHDKDRNLLNTIFKGALNIPGFKQDILPVWKTVQSGHSRKEFIIKSNGWENFMF